MTRPFSGQALPCAAVSPSKSSRSRSILFAYTINELGTWLGYVALALGVYDHTHSGIATAGLFISWRLFPALIVPVLVARIEASNRGGELGSLYAVEALVSAVLALLLHSFWLPGIMLLVAVDGSAAMAASSLLRAAAARAGGEEARSNPTLAARSEGVDLTELGARKANAALNIAFSVTVATGPALGGLLVAGAGGPTALLIDACSFLACALLLGQLRAHVHEEGVTSSVRARLLAARDHLRAVPRLRSLLITEAVAIVFFTSVEPVEVLYSKATLHAGDSGFGLLVAVWGAGMVLGGIIFARRVHRSLGPMLTGGTLLVGLAYIGLAISPSLTLACVAALIGGVGNGVQWASLYSAVQNLTPEPLHGRLMSTVQSMNAICPSIGFLIGGLLAQLASPRTALLVAGLAASAGTFAFLRLSVDGLEASQQDDPSDGGPLNHLRRDLVKPGA
jgi:Transmembrane secretion effector